MNLERVNDRVSQLPMAMAGIVHAESTYGRGLSIFTHTDSSFEKRLLL
ncbi:hypothetical protein [Gorillibacterium massiliense]|nr:hypothetical protein [Gorillibacterium massiliense]